MYPNVSRQCSCQRWVSWSSVAPVQDISHPTYEDVEGLESPTAQEGRA